MLEYHLKSVHLSNSYCSKLGAAYHQKLLTAVNVAAVSSVSHAASNADWELGVLLQDRMSWGIFFFFCHFHQKYNIN